MTEPNEPTDFTSSSYAPGPYDSAWQPVVNAPQETTRGHVGADGRYVPPQATGPGTKFGDVRIDATTVYTPIGEMRRDQTRWTIGETVPGPTRIPTWAVLCAVFLFLCMGPFSLLFLLAKETNGETTTVTLTDGFVTHVMRLDTFDRDGYLTIVRMAEWCQRALPERRALGS